MLFNIWLFGIVFYFVGVLVLVLKILGFDKKHGWVLLHKNDDDWFTGVANIITIIVVGFVPILHWMSGFICCWIGDEQLTDFYKKNGLIEKTTADIIVEQVDKAMRKVR